jgi:hypothetical protein
MRSSSTPSVGGGGFVEPLLLLELEVLEVVEVLEVLEVVLVEELELVVVVDEELEWLVVVCPPPVPELPPPQPTPVIAARVAPRESVTHARIGRFFIALTSPCWCWPRRR